MEINISGDGVEFLESVRLGCHCHNTTMGIKSMSNIKIYTVDDEEPNCNRCDHVCDSDKWCQKYCGGGIVGIVMSEPNLSKMENKNYEID